MKTKQDLIRQDAEIEIVKLEIEHALHQNPMNVPQINKEIDSKYDLKKARAKSLVAAYAKLKAIPTEEQWENLKVFWKDKK